MPSIDERVVAMSFENGVFEARIATTMATLTKFDTMLKNVGSSTGLGNIEADAQKVTLAGPMSALDKLKAKLGLVGDTPGFTNIESASQKVGLEAPMSALDRLKAKLGMTNAGSTFTDMERDSQKVGLEVPMSALDKLKAKFGSTDAGSTFSDMEAASNKVTLDAPMTALDKLKQKLGSTDAGTTFSDMEAASAKVSFEGLSSAIDGIGVKFGAMQTAAIAAFATVVSQATSAAGGMLKSFSIGPITDGLSEYATNLNSIQTILANTQAQGTTLKQVNGALDELNRYSDKTIYNFSQMAKNIGTFTAAGVDLKTSVESIKGIANLAALSGSNAMQASTAMYQLSQAIAAGKVNLQDWNSVNAAGMGGKVFQKALWDTGKAMGTIVNSPVGQTFEQWEKAGNTFRTSLSATQKAAADGTVELKKAQKDAAETIKSAEESAAESAQSANERIKAAQKGVAEEAKKTAEAVAAANDRVKTAEEGVAEAAKRSAESVKNAKEQVKAAHQNVSEVAKQSAENIAAAVKAQSDAVKQSAADVQSALDGVTDAQKRLAEAMKPASVDELQSATDSLQTAQLDQADLASAVTDAQREQTRSAQDLTAAQKKLADLKTAGADPAEILAAQRAVEDAQRRATDASDAQERALLRQRAAARGVTQAQTDLTEVQKKGTAEDQNVKDAQDALTQALEHYKEAQVSARETVIAADKRLADARKSGADAEEEASKRLIRAEGELADARKEGARRQKEAAKQLIDAQKAVTETRKKGVESEKEAANQLAKAQEDEVKTTKDSQERIAKAHEQASERIKAAQDSIAKAKQPQGPMSWLTSDVLTSTLSQFTGDMTAAELKAKGFTDEQIKAIQTTAKTAQKSATEVKTLGQVFSVAKETMGSGWATTFRTIFGNFNEAKGTFTALSNTINGFINTNANARNKVLASWKELGGRTVLIDGIKNAFEAVMSVLKPIKDAFREIFPAKTGQDLFDLTVKFRDFMKDLAIGPETADKLKHTFEGFFAVLHIGMAIIGGVLGVIKDLFGEVGKGSGGFLSVTGSIGDFLVSVDDALTKGGLLKTFFSNLSDILQVPLDLIKSIAHAIGGLFGGMDSGGADKVSSAASGVTDSLKPLAHIVDVVKGAWHGLSGVLGGVKDAVSPMFDNLATVFTEFSNKIADGIKNNDFSVVFSAIQTTLLGGIFLVLKKALGGGAFDVTGGLIKNLNGTFGALTGHLQAMQKNIQAGTLLKIAAAIALLAVGIVALSIIDPKKLASAMTAIAVGLGELVGVMFLLGKMSKTSMVTMPLLAASMVMMATAVDILAIAVIAMSKLSWDEMIRGLAGVAGVLVAVAAGTKLMGPGVLLIGPGLIPLAIGLGILAGVVKIFATMSWKEMEKGLVGVVGALAMVAIGVEAIPASIVLVGPGLIALGIGLTEIAGAVAIFGNMDLKTLGKGMLGVGGSLAVIGLAISLIPPTVALQAIGLNILAVALVGIAGSIALMGSMKVSTLVKGIAAIAGVLIVLALGLTAMIASLPGSVALLAAAAALAVLAPTLVFLGLMKWEVIFKGLAAIALTLGTLAVVGLLAAAPLMLLGSALTVLGFGLITIAASIYLVAKGLSLLGNEGAKGLGIMITAMTAFVALLPTIVINFIKGLVDIAQELAKVAPLIVAALVKIVESLLQVIIEASPKMAIAAGSLILAIIKVLNDNAGPIIEAGWKLLLNLLSGVENNISKVTEKAADIVVKFLEALTSKAPDLVASGVKLLLSFLLGITNHLPDIVATVAKLVTTFLTSVAAHVAEVTAAGVNIILKFVEALGSGAAKLIKVGADAIVSFIEGIGNAGPKIIEAAADAAGKFVRALGKGLVKLASTAMDAIIDFVNGLADAVRSHTKEMNDAGFNLLDAIIDGMMDGVTRLGPKIKNAIGDLIKDLPKKALGILGIHSPSTVFRDIGVNVGEGLALGLRDSGSQVKSTMESTAQDLIETAQNTLGKVPNVLDGIMDVEPTITPVLDLSQVQKDAQKLGDLTNVVPITAAASFGLAGSISVEKQAADTAAATAGQSGTKIELNQYNTSPESLSEIEIYRQTNNQLSQLKSLVGV